MSNTKQKKTLKQKQPRFEEQRYLPRWEFENNVLYSDDKLNDIKLARTRDLTICGVSIVAKEPLNPDQILKLTIFIQGIDKIDVRGKVVWTERVDGKYLVGLDFTHLTKGAQEIILNYAFDLNEEKLKRIVEREKIIDEDCLSN